MSVMIKPNTEQIIIKISAFQAAQIQSISDSSLGHFKFPFRFKVGMFDSNSASTFWLFRIPVRSTVVAPIMSTVSTTAAATVADISCEGELKTEINCRVCYDLIWNLAGFKTGQPALKRADPIRNGRKTVVSPLQNAAKPALKSTECMGKAGKVIG